MRQQQQGDVNLKEVESIPKGAKLKTPDKGKWVLAYGEVSFHAHAIEQIEDCDLYERNGTLYLSVRGPVQLTHEEHHTQTIEPGQYEIGIVREYDYLADMERPVVD